MARDLLPPTAMRAPAGILVVSLLAGCPGQIGDPVDQGGEPLCTRVEPGPSPLRRMTRFEYNNTVRDLLGDATRPADAFVPDEEALGFNNNAYALGVTQILAEQYMTAAEQISIRATEDLPALLGGCDPALDGEDVCAGEFVATFGKRAWRRPLAADELDRLMALFRGARDQWGFEDGVQLVIQALLQSPHFLYRVEMGDPATAMDDVARVSHWEMASRLSYFLWGSMPDGELFAAAEAGRLGTSDEVEAQARRMLADPRARHAIENFHMQWLKLEPTLTLSKDTTMFPTWSPDLRPRLVAETLAFVDHVIFDGDGDVWTLLTGAYTFVDARLAEFYRIDGPAGDTLERVELDPTRHAGILTQGSVLATHAKGNQTSPVHRGKFVREQLLCQLLPAPPDDVMVVPPDLDPSLTTRERYRQHSADPLCRGCHELMDPIGFGFEHFDGVGLWRDDENGLPIDVTGEIIAAEDPAAGGSFDGVTDLAHRLASSQQVRECVARQWFRYANGRGETMSDECTMRSLFDRFEEADHDIRELLIAITVTDAFQYRRMGGAQ